MKRFNKKVQSELSNFRPRKTANCHFVDIVEDDPAADASGKRSKKPKQELEAASVAHIVQWVVWSDLSVQQHIWGLIYAYRSVTDPATVLSTLQLIYDEPKKQLPFGNIDVHRSQERVVLARDRTNQFKLMFLRLAQEPVLRRVFPDSPDDDLDRTTLLQGATFILQSSAFDVAHELSVIEWECYRAIKPRELLSKNWQREASEKLSPNLVALRKRFNQLSFWVVTVLLLAADPNQQQKLYLQLTAIAYELYKMRNYNAMGAIKSGLGNISVERLHLDERMPSKAIAHMEKMEEVLEVAHNFRAYRDLLKEAEDGDIPCIPYLPLHLRDLLFIYERESDHSEDLKDSNGDPLVAYTKLSSLGNSIHSILHYQTLGWGASVSSELSNLLVQVPFMTQDTLHEWSDKWKAESKSQKPSIHVSNPMLASMSEVSTGNLLDIMGSNEQVKELGKARVIRGHVLLQLQCMGTKILRPAPTDMKFRELKRVINSMSGWKDYKLYYGGLGGSVMLEVKQDEDMMGFLSSSTTPTLIVEETLKDRLLKVSKNRRVSTHSSYSPQSSPQVTPREMSFRKTSSEIGGRNPIQRKRDALSASYSEKSDDESSDTSVVEFISSVKGRVVTLEIQFGRISNPTTVLVPAAIPISQFSILCMHLYGTAIDVAIADSSDATDDKTWKHHLSIASKQGRSVPVRITPKAGSKISASTKTLLGNLSMNALTSGDIAKSFDADSVALSPKGEKAPEVEVPLAAESASEDSEGLVDSDGERAITDMF